MANARNEGVTGNLKPFCVGYANTTTSAFVILFRRHCLWLPSDSS
jgi:hypothetical protein